MGPESLSREELLAVVASYVHPDTGPGGDYDRMPCDCDTCTTLRTLAFDLARRCMPR